MNGEALTVDREAASREMLEIVTGILERNRSVPRAVSMLVDGLYNLYAISGKEERATIEQHLRRLLLQMYATRPAEALVGALTMALRKRGE